MIDETHKRWFIFLASACGMAALAGVSMGWLSKSLGWGFSALALPAGLAVGLVPLAFRWSCLAERLAVVFVVAGLGLAMFGWASYLPAWRAETAVANEEVDDLCVRVTAMRLCHERKVMGVFDFSDVPEAIRDEAKQRVARMPVEDKLAMCDQTFGKRINAGATQSPSAGSVAMGSLWVVLALASAAAPALLQHRLGSP
ncbi:MAG: hypothetical protein ACLFTN_07125 [Phycisphaerae bacterium]